MEEITREQMNEAVSHLLNEAKTRHENKTRLQQQIIDKLKSFGPITIRVPKNFGKNKYEL